MNSFEITAALTTSLGVITFAVIFTILYSIYTRSSIKEIRVGKRDIQLMDEYIYEMQPGVKIRRRIWRVLKGIVFYGFLALLIPVFVLSIVNKVQGSVTMINDKALMIVASGSMSVKNEANDYLVSNNLNDQFDTYDIILLERVEDEELKLYDVIAFVDPTSGNNIIHRIIAVESGGTFETRGDSNNTSDEFHPDGESIIGRYTGTRIRALGSFVMFFQSIGGIVTILSLIYCLVMLDYFNGRIRREEDERVERLCASIDFDRIYSTHDLKAEFTETLYYKGFAYHFNESGFVGKDDINEPSFREKSNSTAIRVTNISGKREKKEFPINSEEEDRKTP